jgi:hypothetical protein
LKANSDGIKTHEEFQAKLGEIKKDIDELNRNKSFQNSSQQSWRVQQAAGVL